jgi:hypothetical protein
MFLFVGSFLHAQTSIWKMFESEKFSVQFPIGWKVQEINDDLKKAGIEFLAMADKENAKDLFRENVNLLVENINDATIDLKTYAQKSEDAIKKNIIDLKRFHKKTIKLPSGECYVFQYHGKQSALDLFWYQVVWVKNSIAYILTLTSDERSHWDFKRAFEVIAQSFIIK